MVLILSPNGTYTKKATLELAVASPFAIGKTIVVAEPITCGAVIIPSTIALEVKNGGSIAVTTSLTINGSFSAGLYQVFSGAGSVVFGAIVTAVYPEWWGVDGTDDTVAVSAAIASNRKVILHKGRTYVVTGIEKTGLSNFSIAGGGKLFLKAASPKAVLKISNSTQFDITGVEVDGNGANQNDGAGARGGDRNTGAGIAIFMCTHFTIDNNWVHDNYSGAGILITNKSIVDNVVDRAAHIPAYGKITNNRITHAGYGTTYLGVSFASDGMYVLSDDTTVSGNFIDSPTDYGIALESSYNLNATNNRITNISNVAPGIGVLGCYSGSVQNNWIDTTPLGIAITLGGLDPVVNPWAKSYNILISGNTVLNSNVTGGLSQDGIYVDSTATNISVVNNMVKTTGGRGIVATGIQSQVNNNSVSYIATIGVYLGGVYSQAVGNSIKNTTGVPIYWDAVVGQVVDDLTLKGYTDFTLLSSWLNYGAPYANAGFNITGKTVRLQGSIKTGTMVAGTPIALLPVGYRPPSSRYFTVNNNGILGTILINSAGNVLIGYVPNNVLLSLDGIAFDTH